MKTTHRDIETFARILARAARAARQQQPPVRIVNAVVRDVCEWFAENNAAFDPTRFMSAVWGKLPHDLPHETQPLVEQNDADPCN